jgi:hypothetical protein
MMSHNRPQLGVWVHSPWATTFARLRHQPLKPGPCRCLSMRCKGPSRLMHPAWTLNPLLPALQFNWPPKLEESYTVIFRKTSGYG